MSVVGQHCVKYRSFTEFPGVEILQEGAVSAEFWANLAFPQNFHTRKLGETTVFNAVRNMALAISHFLQELLRTTDINLHAHYF